MWRAQVIRTVRRCQVDLVTGRARRFRTDLRLQFATPLSAQCPTAWAGSVAHLLQYRAQNWNMANKATLMKLLQESRGYEQITNRRPTPRPIVLYLMQLREQTAHIHAPKQHLTITADWQNGAETPLPVRIHHIKPGECGLPVVFI